MKFCKIKPIKVKRARYIAYTEEMRNAQKIDRKS